jgi:hypothetical protein
VHNESQIVKAEKTTVKNGCWITQPCKIEITDQIDAKLQGFVMDSASANRAAFSLLDADDAMGPLVNLQCTSRTLSLLLKDIDQRMPFVHNAFERALMVSTFFQSACASQLAQRWMNAWQVKLQAKNSS